MIIRPNQTAHHLLKALVAGFCTLPELHVKAFLRVNSISLAGLRSTSMARLVKAGYAELVSPDVWKITDLGITTSADADRRHAAKVATPKPENLVKANLYVADRGNYTCPELGRTCHRPGAYDYTEHPSLINGNRVQYKVCKP